MSRLAAFSLTPPPLRRFIAGLGLALALTLTGGVAQSTTVGPVLELATPLASQRAPTVSWDAQEQVYVIVWEDRRNDGSTGVDLYVARIDPDGTLRDTNGHSLLDPSASAGNETQPSIVYNPQTFAHMVAWTEARDGLTDIFFTRIFASRAQMAPTIVPTAGVQVSSGTDSEIEPDVAIAFQTFLVTYQTNVVGGDRVIRGRRVYPDGSFLDDQSMDLSGPSAASPASLGMGTNFMVAYSQGGDIFIRSVPDFGVVPSVVSSTITPVTTATLGQGRPDISQLGAGGIMTVWQDNRAFGTLSTDIFGRRFTPTLAPLGPDGPVLTATAAQQFPALAGNDVGTLAVWQDRRFSGSNGIIMATRIDPATGQPIDIGGFPVLALSANAFEPTAAKGPNTDYLVAAVRFDASTPRVFYRIVRDEVPDGTMTAMGNLMVPADGVTTADVTFGAAVGASGLDVVDGTLYTVTLSDNTVEVLPPDQDATLPGHQIKSGNGAVFMGLRTTAHILVDVTVQSVEGNSSGTGQVTFLNVPAVVDTVAVGPLSPRSDATLQLSYNYTDINQDPEDTMQRFIQWTANSQIKPAHAGQISVPGTATRKGEQWRAEIRPHDGIEFGTRVFSNTVIVRNTPPAALDARIVPDADVRTGTGLQARYIFRDEDGDPETGTEIRWYESDVEQMGLRDETEVPAARIVKAQRWYFTVRPGDGDPDEGFGPLQTSPTVNIVNTAPVAAAGENLEVLERRTIVLTGLGSSDLDPQDVLSYEWVQVVLSEEPVINLSSTSSATPSFTAPSVQGTTLLTFDLVVRDDEEPSPADRITVRITAVPDQDGDFLDDEEEVIAGTNPMLADTDRDGLRDGEEVKGLRMLNTFLFLGTDPLDEDSDDDGIRDGAEGRTTKDGTEFDPRGDADGDDIVNALDPDSDNDGVFDGTELGVRSPLNGGMNGGFTFGGTDEGAGFFVADADADTQTNPLVADTDSDTLSDGQEDTNKNGAVDDGETDPNNPEDPGISCGSGQPECPAGLTCTDGTCRVGGTDGGLMCTPLPDTLECCTGGCTGGTEIAAICQTQGARETCPVGAQQCAAGACSAPVVPPDSGGCTCTTPRSTSSAAWLLSFGLLLGIRRRRAAAR